MFIENTLTKGMFVGRYEVHDPADTGLGEQGLLVEVDDPGVVLQDVVVLLQAVLQSSRLVATHCKWWKKTRSTIFDWFLSLKLQAKV